MMVPVLVEFLPMTFMALIMSSISKASPVPPLAFNTARFLSLGAGLALWVTLAPSSALHRDLRGASAADWAAAAATGALLLGVSTRYVQLLRHHGLAVTVALSNALAVLGGALVGVALFGEALSLRRGAGLLLLVAALLLLG